LTPEVASDAVAERVTGPGCRFWPGSLRAAVGAVLSTTRCETTALVAALPSLPNWGERVGDHHLQRV
jgi:hypothetical protein